MTMVDRLCWRVAATSEAKAEDTSQAAPRATVHVMLKEGTDTTLCGKLEALDTTRMNVLRVVSCPDCNAELKKIRQRNSRDGHARMVERRNRQAEEAEREQNAAEAFEEDQRRRKYRESELFHKLRQCCGFIENGSAEPLTISQDDATGGWSIRIGTERIASTVPLKMHKPRSYHAAGFHEVIDMAYAVEKQED